MCSIKNNNSFQGSYIYKVYSSVARSSPPISGSSKL